MSHLYNLRRSAAYRKVAAVFESTRPSAVSIAERRRPEPHGQPGFLRVDTVHQGDWGEEKGVYHINAVDTVTQWQVVGCVEQDQRAVSAAGAGSHTAPVSLPNPGFPFRQRFGVHQPQSGRDAGEAADRVHQIAAQPQPGQRPGGGQERSGDSQAHRLRTHSQPACRAGAEVLHGAPERVSELSPAMRLCHRNGGRTRQAATAVQAGRLCRRRTRN